MSAQDLWAESQAVTELCVAEISAKYVVWSAWMCTAMGCKAQLRHAAENATMLLIHHMQECIQQAVLTVCSCIKAMRLCSSTRLYACIQAVTKILFDHLAFRAWKDIKEDCVALCYAACALTVLSFGIKSLCFMLIVGTAANGKT